MTKKFQYPESKKLDQQIDEIFKIYKETFAQDLRDQATDDVRDTDWSRSLIEILQDELKHYQDKLNNPDELKHLAHLVANVAGTASMYSLPIDSQLLELSDYLDNAIDQQKTVDIDKINELLNF